MSVVSLNSIDKAYGITGVLDGFSLHVNEKERIGLIGPNGCGKTTVFKIIAGMEQSSEGTIALRRNIKVGYLSQMPDFNPDNTLLEELETVFTGLIKIESRLRQLEKTITEKSHEKAGSENISKLMDEYSQLQHEFEVEGGYQYESEIREIAYGMGFSEAELINKYVSNLSGGEKTRLGLVKLLLSDPDLLLLDEPTNHLDLPSIQWLENYLEEYRGTAIIVSHDRYFLDQVVDRIVEIKNGTDEIYYGNYSYYLKERKRRHEQLLKEYENQQKKIKKMEEAIKRLHRWGNQGDNEKFFRQAKSMQKRLDKIDRLDKPVLDGKQMGLDLSIDERSGDEVLRIKNLCKSFSTQPILDNLNLNIYWEEKVALIGRNGSGKTTLIKIILDTIKPDMGSVEIGAKVEIGYYSQEFEGFNPEDDLVTALRRECDMGTAEARNALAAFLFTDNEVFKKVKDLSGGEKSRLRLLQLMNGNYNFLILDEPTNHLDLPSREILEETLANYPGTVLVVSHDRYFLNKVIDYIYELEEGEVTKFYGDYDYYRDKKEEFIKQKDDDQSTDNNGKGKSDYHILKEKARQERKRKNRLTEIEEKIGLKENRIKEIEKEMIAPVNLDNIELLNRLKEEYNDLKEDLNNLYKNWENLIEEEG